MNQDVLNCSDGPVSQFLSTKVLLRPKLASASSSLALASMLVRDLRVRSFTPAIFNGKAVPAACSSGALD